VVWSRLGEWERAHEAFERASSTVAQGERAALLTDWGRMLHRRGDSLGAAQIARSALEHARVNGGERDLARALNLLGLLARADDDMIAAREHFERGLALAHDEPLLEAGILNNLALLCGAEGDSERALSFAQRALDLCRRLGDRPCEAALHSNIADLLHALRGPEGAMEHLKAAAAIYADVARDADTWFPEVWKLYAW
jgi:tetratricopeptide (TPR) repeat protein